ncbi:MAG: ECF transporter S component [Oscillospiraceae bacterium]|nr:ECF transporter S component [Oscillospiraceae bacterium]
MNKKPFDVHKLVGMAIFTAIVVVLEWVSAAVGHVGIFTFTLALIPIVVGAALYGVEAGAWLGFVFGVIVLISGDAAPFWAVNILGTVITVLLKGTFAGFVSGLVYKALSKRPMLGVVASAVAAPVMNTGVFLLGCLVFFLPTIREWGAAAGFENAGTYMVLGFVGINFLIEMLINIVLSPVILRLIRIGQRRQA